MINPTRSEEGNELYNFYEEKNKESESITYHLFEIYKDSVALDFHRSTAYFKNYRSKIEELLAKPIEVKILNSIGLDSQITSQRTNGFLSAVETLKKRIN